VEINSDSRLLVQSINEGWKRKANPDLWAEIDRFLPKINFKLSWVKAHADNEYNNRCDELALGEATKAQKMLKKNPALAPAVLENISSTEKNNPKNQTALF
jgi:ribonuclease HI